MAFHMVLPQTYLPKPDTQPSTCRWNRNEPSIHQMEPIAHIGEIGVCVILVGNSTTRCSLSLTTS